MGLVSSMRAFAGTDMRASAGTGMRAIAGTDLRNCTDMRAIAGTDVRASAGTDVRAPAGTCGMVVLTEMSRTDFCVVHTLTFDTLRDASDWVKETSVRPLSTDLPTRRTGRASTRRGRQGFNAMNAPQPPVATAHEIATWNIRTESVHRTND